MLKVGLSLSYLRLPQQVKNLHHLFLLTFHSGWKEGKIAQRQPVHQRPNRIESRINEEIRRAAEKEADFRYSLLIQQAMIFFPFFFELFLAQIAKTGNVEIYLKWFRREKGVEKSRDIIQIEYTNGLAEKYAEKNKEKREKLCEIEAKLKVRLVDIIFSSSESQIAQVRN